MDSPFPRSTARNMLTAVGRVENRIATAFVEPLPMDRVARLRNVWTAFARKPSLLGPLWLPFLHRLFADPAWWWLTTADFDELRETGMLVVEGAGGRLGLEAVWRPLITALDARGQHPAATRLLADLADADSVDSATRTRITCVLARRGADGEEFLPLYVRRMGEVGFDRAEPEIAQLVKAALETGFDVPPARVRRAGLLAQGLHGVRVRPPGADRALGFYYLVVDRNDEGAVLHFQEALESNPADDEVLAGLVCSLIRDGQHERSTALAVERHGSRASRCAELFVLSTTLTWLENVTAEERRPPCDSTGLLRLTIAPLVGDWLTYAVGRLYLLEGDAGQAARVLEPLADRNPDRVDWGYHAASALALTGDPDGVRRRMSKADGWSGRWTIGCLLVDLDATEVDRLDQELNDHTVPERYTPVVSARVRLAERERVVPRDDGWRRGGGTTAEDLESLRTALGEWFAAGHPGALSDALSLPAFAHLPYAEQLLWRGLSLLPRDEQRADALLETAATVFRHPRAALVLSVLRLSTGQRAAADELFELFSWRNDGAARLLRAWSTLRAGQEQEAIAQLAELESEGDVRAHRALGAVHLAKATRSGAGGQPDAELAAVEFRAAREHDEDVDVEFLLSYAEFVATGTWPPPAGSNWPPPTHLRGLGWSVALAELAGSPTHVDLDMARFVVSGSSGRMGSPVAAVVAALLARACVVSPDSGRAGELADLLVTLAVHVPIDDETLELAAAAAVRHGHAEHELARRARNEKMHPALALAVAGSEWERGRSRAAVDALRAVRPADDEQSRFCEILADLLDGRETAEPARWNRVGTQVALAVDIVRLLVLATGGAPAFDETLVRLMSEHELDELVDPRASLPLLCANAASRRGRPPEVLVETVRRLVGSVDTGIEPLVLARCAAALGDRETASTLWRTMLDGAGAEVGAEAVGVLAHHAVLTRDTDREQAVEWLSEAARGDHAPTDLAGLAKNLEDEILIDRLLSRLFPNSPDKRERPGRHPVLEGVVDGSEELRSALLSDDAADFAVAWRSCLARRRGDTELHHALAALYLERALDDGASDLLLTATAMWASLMGTAEFWQRFGDVDAAQRANLIDRIFGDLLERNVTEGGRAFDAGETDAAAAHLRLLAECQEGAAKLISLLRKNGIPWGYREIEVTAVTQVAKLAGERFQTWCGNVVRGSESATEDFEDRVGRLAAFVGLGVPVSGVALAGLQRCNEWIHDVYPGDWDTDFTRFVKDVHTQAQVFVDELTATGERGLGYRPENQALSTYLNLQGSAHFSGDPDRARRNYREALSWNPSNGNPKNHLRNLGEDVEGDQ